MSITHPRQIIRQALVDKLKTTDNGQYPTLAEDRIFASRVKPLFDQFLPAILVYAREENILEERWDRDGFGPLKRELEMAVEAVVKGEETMDNLLDEAAWQIEKALDGWEIPIRTADVPRLKSTEIDASIEGSKVYGAIRLTFTMTYWTEAKQPDFSGTTPNDIIVGD